MGRLDSVAQATIDALLSLDTDALKALSKKKDALASLAENADALASLAENAEALLALLDDSAESNDSADPENPGE